MFRCKHHSERHFLLKIRPRPRRMQILETTGASSTKDREAYLNRAHALLISQPATAVQLFDEWLKRHREDVDALLGRGLAEYFEGDYAASANSFGAARRAQPEHIAASVNEALALEAAGQRAQAIARWKEILGLKIDPGPPFVHRDAGENPGLVSQGRVRSTTSIIPPQGGG